jgi:hypothetical protein
MSDRPIIVKSHEVAVPPPRAVTVRNASLSNALVRKPDEALALLNMVAPVQLEDISIDERGSVLIENEEFIKAIRAIPGAVTKPELAAGNFICGAGCGVEAIGTMRPTVDAAAGNFICGAGCGVTEDLGGAVKRPG